MPLPVTAHRSAELLDFVFATCPEVKRAKVRQWLKHGSINVNGRPITHFNHLLQPGDVVSLSKSKNTAAAGLLAAGIKVLSEDDSILVIEKPEGLLSMATEKERQKTAYAFLTDYVRRGQAGSSARVWIVHRLDRQTSGVMVFAKSEAAKRALQSQWRQAVKRYLAVVEGKPPAGQGVFESHLNESHHKVYSAAASEQTRRAVTRYRVMKQNATGALIELTPETGRRNQIRVHLADAGCPVIGDRKYGARTNPARRLGLHASSLQFDHPRTGEPLHFQSALPASLAKLL
jgi:23S rRNA pseudouridine1911/1915/1917 synthase